MPKLLRCYKAFHMVDEGKAFSRGKDYPILREIEFTDEPSEFIVINDNGQEHIMPWDVLVKKHFTLIIHKKGGDTVK